MADMLLTGVQWAATQQETYAGRTVTYTRGVHSVSVTATVGHTLFKQSDTAGRLRMQHGDRDYLIRAATIRAALVAWGETKTDPQPGDTIADSVESETYTVADPNSSEPCYRKSDPFGIRLRIHTKQTG